MTSYAKVVALEAINLTLREIEKRTGELPFVDMPVSSFQNLINCIVDQAVQNADQSVEVAMKIPKSD